MKYIVALLITWAIICGPLAGIGALYLCQLSETIGFWQPTQIQVNDYAGEEFDGTSVVSKGGIKNGGKK